MTAAKRHDAGAAVGGLFERASATGGLARRPATPPGQPPATPELPDATRATGERRRRVSGDGREGGVEREPRVRLGVELTESELAFLRGLSRPARTGQPRTLGAKLVATGVLAAAIDLLAGVDVEMDGVRAGDLGEMSTRARAALLTAAAAAARSTEGDGD